VAGCRVIASCLICGQLVRGSRPNQILVVEGPSQNGASDPEATRKKIDHQYRLAELDNLMLEMLAHCQRDHADLKTSIAAVAQLAAKVFTGHQLRSGEADFEHLRAEWKETIRRAVFQEVLSAADSAGESSGSTSGS
jgi:hypothetical protein